MEDDAEERGVDLQAAIVFDEAELAEFVHEEIDAGAGGADHFGESFLRDFGEDALRLVFGAVACEKEKRAGEAFFAGVEKLVDEIFFDADVAREHVGDEAVGEGVLVVEDADHFLFFDDQGGGGSDGRGGADADGLAGQATFAEKITGAQDSDDGFFAGFVDDGEADGAFLDVEHVFADVTLREDCLLFFEFGNFARDAGGIEKILSVE